MHTGIGINEKVTLEKSTVISRVVITVAVRCHHLKSVIAPPVIRKQ
jgi:hypothetical protein